MSGQNPYGSASNAGSGPPAYGAAGDPSQTRRLPDSGQPYGNSPQPYGSSGQDASGQQQPYGQNPQTSQGGFAPYPGQGGYEAGARPGRPPGIIAAAVLDFVLAGFVLIAAFLVLLGAGLVAAVEGGAGGGLLTLAALLNFALFVTLIVGGILLILGKDMWIHVASTAVCVVLCVAWLISGSIFWSLFFLALSAPALGLTFVGGPAWIASRKQR